MEEWFETIDDYLDQFGETPGVIGIPEEKLEKAIELLAEAMENDEPISADEFREKLGLEALSKEDVI